MFDDLKRPSAHAFRYIERGFYSRQLEIVFRHVPSSQVCILIFEEDIVANPNAGWQKVCKFLGIEPRAPVGLDKPVNSLRLSGPAIRASRLLYNVPYARSIVRRLDKLAGLPAWRPVFSDETISSLREIYAPENEALFELLGRRIPAWEAT